MSTSQPTEGEAYVPIRVLRQFRLVYGAARAHFGEIQACTGISGAQLWALSIIVQTPGIGVGGVAQAMDLHPSTASNLVRSLVQRQLVSTSRRRADRRAVQLKARAAGVRTLRDAPRPSAGVLPDALRQLDRMTLRRLDRGLGALIAALGADHDRFNVPLGHR